MTDLSTCKSALAPDHHLMTIHEGQVIAFKIGGVRTPEAGEQAFQDLMDFYQEHPVHKLLFDMRDARYPFPMDQLIARGTACAQALPATHMAILVSEESEDVGVICMTTYIMTGHKCAMFTSLQEALAYLMWE